MEETRSNDNEEEKVTRLLGGLPAVEAPENFEAMVRSQIAERRNSEPSGRPVFWLAMKFALPMLLLVALGAFLIISDESSLNVELVPPVESPSIASVDLEEKLPSKDLAVNSQNDSVRSPQVNRNSEVPKTAPSLEEKALSQDDTTMFPPGVDPRRVAGKVSAPAVLRMLGIEVSCSNAGCEVVSIQQNSIASNLGLEQGDLIEAIDDKRIGAASMVEGSVTTLRIVRAGKHSTIALRPH